MMSSGEEPMHTIRQVSAELGVSNRTLRHYDETELIPVARDERNFRVFSPAARRELQVVVRLRRAGVPLEEIRWVLECGRRSGPEALRKTAADCLAYRLSRLEAQRAQVEEAKRWLDSQSEQGSAELNLEPRALQRRFAGRGR